MKFIEYCTLKGWRVDWSEDIVKTNNESHKLICIHGFELGTLKDLTKNSLETLFEATTTTSPTYIAWILSETPMTSIILYLLNETPDLLQKVAFYDLSSAFSLKTCLKLNKTKSIVFHEFERFLNSQYQLKLFSLNLPTQSGEYIL